MKIKSIACTQFAGIRDRNVVFSDGLNVVFGKNESGKSTLAHLLSRTLFQDAKLDKRSDKEFIDLYLPGESRKQKMMGDFADGQITFETERGTYILSKAWGSGEQCTLSTPDGVFRDQGRINEALKQVLLYGEGVYDEILLSSQRNMDASLQRILDASQKTETKQEITDALSQAFLESDGVSVDAVEQAIAGKIEEITGKHWEIDRKAPKKRNNGDRWSKDLGEILKAYYALEDARGILDNILQLESETDRANQAYADADQAAHSAEVAYDQFHKYASRIALLSRQKKDIHSKEQELQKESGILADWPVLAESLEKARQLQTQKRYRKQLERYNRAKKTNDEITALKATIAGHTCPSKEDIALAEKALKNLGTLERKLCGMNVSAAIQMLHDHRVEITSLHTGAAVDISNGVASITEAVVIRIPGVMEMQLSPADVDVASVKKQIEIQKSTIDRILAKYGVGSLEDLRGLKDRINDTQGKIDIDKNLLSFILETETFEQVEAAANTIPGFVPSSEDIERNILAICGNKEIDKFVIEKETILTGYANDFGSIKNLQDQAHKLEAELVAEKASVADASGIPSEYLSISNPEEHLELLQRKMEETRHNREKALDSKLQASNKLELYQESIAADPAERLEQAERTYEEQKAMLDHWLHIQEVFMTLKNSIHEHPLQDIAQHFAQYLSLISDGKVVSEFPDMDKLDMTIYSAEKRLNFGKLSEGTKEVVSLAFRLAVLDHLFPDGGVIVLDDSLTDMDDERTMQSCRLIKSCATRHQVIFLTCKADCAEMLGGNMIQM